MLLLCDDSAKAMHAQNADIAHRKPQPPHQGSASEPDQFCLDEYVDSEFDDLDSVLDDEFFVTK